MLYYLTKEALGKSNKNSLEELHTQKLFVNKFVIGQLLLSEPVANTVRKVLKSMASEAKVTNEDILQIIEDEIIKREVLDGDKAIEARKKVLKATATAKPKEETLLADKGK